MLAQSAYEAVCYVDTTASRWLWHHVLACELGEFSRGLWVGSAPNYHQPFPLLICTLGSDTDRKGMAVTRRIRKVAIWLVVLSIGLGLNPAPTRYAVDAGALPGALSIAPRAALNQLRFEPNVGQFAPSVRYQARGSDYSVALTSDGAALLIGAVQLRFGVAGGDLATPIASQPLAGVSNYLQGNDPSRWHVGVPAYARVTYQNVYPGISLSYYDGGAGLEYDFILAAHADPSRIRLRISGADKLSLAADTLEIHTLAGTIQQPAPHIYQDTPAGRQPVSGGFRLLANSAVGFQLDAYNPSLPLVIDPQIVYSTQLGGNAYGDGQGYETQAGSAITISPDGSAYVAGTTYTSDFPVSATAVQTSFLGNRLAPNYWGSSDHNDAVVLKLSPDGSQLLYATYLGGSGDDEASAISLDRAGNIYIAGITSSSDFPAATPLVSGVPGSAFLVKLNPSGRSIIYSHYLSGVAPEGKVALAVTGGGETVVAGGTLTATLPVRHALQPRFGGGDEGYNGYLSGGDGFLMRIAADGKTLKFATYLGGSHADAIRSVAIDRSGAVYVTGYTRSQDFPVRHAAQPLPGGVSFSHNPWGDDATDDAFIAKLTPDGSHLVYATYLGAGGNDEAYSLALDRTGAAYVAGVTSSADFPTRNAVQPHAGGGLDTFLAKLAPDGSHFVYVTYYGGPDDDGMMSIARGCGANGGFDSSGVAVAVDTSGAAYLTGSTLSYHFPTFRAFQPDFGGGNSCQKMAANGDAFIVKFSPDGQRVVYASYLGGSSGEEGRAIAVDGAGDAYLTGRSWSSDFPTRNPVAANTSCGLDGKMYFCDGAKIFITKISDPPPPASHYFTETGHLVAAPFYAYWEAGGGVARFGYPISDRLRERSLEDGRIYSVQYFEQARLEYHPDNPAAPVEEGLVGRELYLARYPNGAPGQHPYDRSEGEDDTPRYFTETGKTLHKSFHSYWDDHDGMVRLGYPISDQFTEDGKMVQYFERGVLERVMGDNGYYQPPQLRPQLGRSRYLLRPPQP